MAGGAVEDGGGEIPMLIIGVAGAVAEVAVVVDHHLHESAAG